MLKKFFNKFKGDYNNELEKRLIAGDPEIENTENQHSEDGEFESYLNQFERNKADLNKKNIEAAKQRWEYQKQLLSKPAGTVAAPKIHKEEEEELQETVELETTQSELSEEIHVPKGLHPEGTLLSIENLGIGIYKERVPAKGYDIVYLLLEDKLSPQGIMLNMYRREVAGKIPPHIFKHIKEEQTWSRSQIKPYLSDERYGCLLPGDDDQIVEIQEEEKNVETQTGSGVTQENLRYMPHGQIVVCQMGAKTWESVYWMKDELGHVVAHNTNGDWQLMHLDLHKFAKMNMLKFGDQLSEEELEAIREHVKYHKDK